MKRVRIFGTDKVTLYGRFWVTPEVELSAKVEAEPGALAYSELRQWALDNRLKLAVDQRFKTRMVLESHPTTTAH
jgi:hypothetical protein